MLSFFLAIVGYFFAALVFLLDRYILKEKIPNPSVYAFFVGLFSFFAITLIPFGFSFFSFWATGISLFSGMFFIYGLVGLYSAIRLSNIVRIAPLWGSLTTVFVLVFCWAGCFLRGESIHLFEMIGVFFLVCGGILFSLRLPFQTRVFFRGFRYTIFSAMLIALFLVGFQMASKDQNFVSVYVWSRLGMFLGAVSLFLYLPFRRDILDMYRGLKGKEKKEKRSGVVLVFLANKGLGATAHFLNSLAIFFGSAVVVQALASAQFAFVAILSILAAPFFPNVFRTQMRKGFAIQMAVAFFFVVFGMIFVALEQNVLFL